MNQHQQAKDQYLNTNRTQKDIAGSVGISERTMYRWIKQEAWDDLKKATLAAPAVAVEHLYSQFAELNNSIAARPEGSRIPTMQEAEITRKLVNSIIKLGTAHSLGTQIQVMQAFTSHMVQADHDFTLKLTRYFTSYITGKVGKGGYKPYQFLYGVDDPTADPKHIESLKKEIAKEEEKECDAPSASPQQLTTWRNIGTDIPPRLKNGPLWAGNGKVYDYNANCFRPMMQEEALEFRKLGFDTEWDKYNQPETGTQSNDTKMSGSQFPQPPDISIPTQPETLTPHASTPIAPKIIPLPPPDISGHSKDQEQEQDLIPQEYKDVYPTIPLLPHNVKWLGKGHVYDPQIKRKREIKFGELNYLRRLGYDRQKLGY